VKQWHVDDKQTNKQTTETAQRQEIKRVNYFSPKLFAFL